MISSLRLILICNEILRTLFVSVWFKGIYYLPFVLIDTILQYRYEINNLLVLYFICSIILTDVSVRMLRVCLEKTWSIYSFTLCLSPLLSG